MTIFKVPINILKRIFNKIVREIREPLIDFYKGYKISRFFDEFSRKHISETAKRPERDKPYVWFIIEKWVDCNPKSGLTNNFDNLIYSLDSTDSAIYSCFHYDEYSLNHGDLDFKILQECDRIKPDLIIFDFVSLYKNNVSAKTLQIISRNLNVPIIMILFDSAYEIILRIAGKYAPFAKKIIVLDSSVSYEDRPRLKSKSIHLWTPQNPKLFFNPGKERDIGISFIGSTERYPDRRKAIECIIRNGINIYVTGGRCEKNISPEELADVYKRSKIVINFPYTPLGRLQFKGRPIEATLCGAAIMELNNPAINKWFTPMVDYIAYDDLDDLIRKIKYFLSHEDELERIRKNGHLKALHNYNAKIFWERVIRLAAN